MNTGSQRRFSTRPSGSPSGEGRARQGDPAEQALLCAQGRGAPADPRELRARHAAAEFAEFLRQAVGRLRRLPEGVAGHEAYAGVPGPAPTARRATHLNGRPETMRLGYAYELLHAHSPTRFAAFLLLSSLPPRGRGPR